MAGQRQETPLGAAVLSSLDPQTYGQHPLHQLARDWYETNCYTDLWIELLHSLDLDPLACLPFTMAIDFEGDQWTFIKPSHSDLYALYGIDVQELNVWSALENHTLEQLRRQRLVLAELDAFHLPDTHATDYHTKHSKTTVAINLLDPARARMAYFHNAGYFELEGDDYGQLFRSHAPAGALPGYVEFAKVSGVRRSRADDLVKQSLILLHNHLRRAPKSNPVEAFSPSFTRDVERLQSGQLSDYHAYAFATLRQLGGAFELAAHYLHWLEQNDEPGLSSTIDDFRVISSTAKSLILKTARAIMTGKPAEFGQMLSVIGASWASGMERLQSRYG